MNYNNRRFKAVSNSENGQISTEMVFEYHQKGQVLSCTYSGKNIVFGQLVGLVDGDGNIEMSYHQINLSGELMTGKCRSTPVLLPNGKIRLFEKWQWTSGDHSAGESILEEI